MGRARAGKCLVVQFRRVSWGQVGGSGRVGRAALMQVFALGQLCQDLNEVVQPPEVAILSVPFHPGHVVLENLSLRQRGGFPKVNHPDFGLFLLVVNEEEGAPDYLQRGEGPVSGAPIAHSQTALGLSDTLSQAAFARDGAEILHEQKQALCAAGCLHMQIWYSDKLMYSHKSQLLAEGEDQKNMSVKNRDVILETESKSLLGEGMR